MAPASDFAVALESRLDQRSSKSSSKQKRSSQRTEQQPEHVAERNENGKLENRCAKIRTRGGTQIMLEANAILAGATDRNS
jgi:hypothetical protein